MRNASSVNRVDPEQALLSGRSRCRTGQASFITQPGGFRAFPPIAPCRDPRVKFEEGTQPWLTDHREVKVGEDEKDSGAKSGRPLLVRMRNALRRAPRRGAAYESCGRGDPRSPCGTLRARR